MITKRAMDTEKVRAFLLDISKVCHQHGLSISHEDAQGAFIIEPLKMDNLVWLTDALDNSEAS
jgi:hypothetical protein